MRGKVSAFKKALAVVMSVLLIVTGTAITGTSFYADYASVNGDQIATIVGSYDDYSNGYNILGVAGDFHLFAQNRVDTMVHTNGNIAADIVSTGTNFGTNQAVDHNIAEYSYARYLFPIASQISSSSMILGRQNYVEKVGGQTKINGTITDCNLQKDPYKVLYEDENKYFIDLDNEFLYLEGLSRALSAMSGTITKLSGANRPLPMPFVTCGLA